MVAPAGTGTVTEEFNVELIAPKVDHPAMVTVDPDDVPPAWVTVKVRPAIVTVPTRAAEPVLAGHETVTDALPVPLVGETESHEAPDVADHEHPEPLAERKRLVDHEEAPTDAPEDGSENVQADAPACVTETVCPATETTPVRDELDVFCEQVRTSVAEPDPDDGLTDSHDALELAVHPQVAELADSVTNPVHAAAVADMEPAESA